MTRVLESASRSTKRLSRSSAVAHEGPLSIAVVTCAVGAFQFVVRDGELGWRIVRGSLVVVVAAALLAVVRSGGRWPGAVRARGAVGVLAGAGALAAGVGVALPHIDEEGVSVTAFAGLLLLGGGLALVVLGWMDLVRRSPWWAHLLGALACAVIVALALYTLGQAVGATNVPRTEVGPTTPADLGLAQESVTFRSDDGVTLSGWYVPSANGAAVALLHGAGSTRSGVLEHAAILARRGYGVLLFDARGHGRSGGRAMDFGWYGDLDTRAAVDFLVARPDVHGSIGVLGLSMGGEQALGAAAADDRIHAVVAEGAGQRVAEDKDWLSAEHGWRGALQERLERLTFALTDLLTEAAPPTPLRAAVAASASRPVLLIAAGEVADEASAAAFIASGAPERAQVWIVDGAGHTGALGVAPGEWEQRVADFLDGALTPST